MLPVTSPPLVETSQVALPPGLRVAIVHDYLTQRGGAERVVLAMLEAFPQARIITAVYDADATFDEFRGRDVETTGLQRVGALKRDPRRALPFLSTTFGRLRVDDVDAVLCSSSGWAHGIKTDAPKLVYCYNPARWIYQHSDYIVAQPLAVRAGFKLFRPYLRRWDKRAAGSADRYLTSSTVVQERIREAYGIQADLLPPPVSLDALGDLEPVVGVDPGFFLVVGRARGYKNVQHACEAFEQLPDQRLVVVGGLPERQSGGSWPGTITGLQGIPDAQLRWLYTHCRAVLAVSHEDFGLTPLEGNAFGRPALVLRAGGFLDTMVEGVTGHFVEELSTAALLDTVRLSLSADLDSEAILQHADRYSLESFVAELRREVLSLLP